MKNNLEKRLERIKIFIDNGYTADLETGIIYSPSRKNNNKLEQRGSNHPSGYIRIVTSYNNEKIIIKAHQFIYYLSTGKVVEIIDHINRIKTDNRAINLRESSPSENQQNKECKGYTFRKDINKWAAYITINGITKHLGNHLIETEAREAYLEAKEKYHTTWDLEEKTEY